MRSLDPRDYRPVKPAEAATFKGRRVRKFFADELGVEGTWYEGDVVSFDNDPELIQDYPGGVLFQVVYDDGDEEEYNVVELLDILVGPHPGAKKWLKAPAPREEATLESDEEAAQPVREEAPRRALNPFSDSEDDAEAEPPGAGAAAEDSGYSDDTQSFGGSDRSRDEEVAEGHGTALGYKAAQVEARQGASARAAASVHTPVSTSAATAPASKSKATPAPSSTAGPSRAAASAERPSAGPAHGKQKVDAPVAAKAKAASGASGLYTGRFIGIYTTKPNGQGYFQYRTEVENKSQGFSKQSKGPFDNATDCALAYNALAMGMKKPPSNFPVHDPSFKYWIPPRLLEDPSTQGFPQGLLREADPLAWLALHAPKWTTLTFPSLPQAGALRKKRKQNEAATPKVDRKVDTDRMGDRKKRKVEERKPMQAGGVMSGGGAKRGKMRETEETVALGIHTVRVRGGYVRHRPDLEPGESMRLGQVLNLDTFNAKVSAFKSRDPKTSAWAKIQTPLDTVKMEAPPEKIIENLRAHLNLPRGEETTSELPEDPPVSADVEAFRIEDLDPRKQLRGQMGLRVKGTSQGLQAGAVVGAFRGHFMVKDEYHLVAKYGIGRWSGHEPTRWRPEDPEWALEQEVLHNCYCYEFERNNDPTRRKQLIERGKTPPKELVLSAFQCGNLTALINDASSNVFCPRRRGNDRAQAARNVAFLEVLVHGWPCLFAVTTKAVAARGELLCLYSDKFVQVAGEAGVRASLNIAPAPAEPPRPARPEQQVARADSVLPEPELSAEQRRARIRRMMAEQERQSEQADRLKENQARAAVRAASKSSLLGSPLKIQKKSKQEGVARHVLAPGALRGSVAGPIRSSQPPPSYAGLKKPSLGHRLVWSGKLLPPPLYPNNAAVHPLQAHLVFASTPPPSLPSSPPSWPFHPQDMFPEVLEVKSFFGLEHSGVCLWDMLDQWDELLVVLDVEKAKLHQEECKRGAAGLKPFAAYLAKHERAAVVPVPWPAPPPAAGAAPGPAQQRLLCLVPPGYWLEANLLPRLVNRIREEHGEHFKDRSLERILGQVPLFGVMLCGDAMEHTENMRILEVHWSATEAPPGDLQMSEAALRRELALFVGDHGAVQAVRCAGAGWGALNGCAEVVMRNEYSLRQALLLCGRSGVKTRNHGAMKIYVGRQRDHAHKYTLVVEFKVPPGTKINSEHTSGLLRFIDHLIASPRLAAAPLDILMSAVPDPENVDHVNKPRPVAAMYPVHADGARRTDANFSTFMNVEMVTAELAAHVVHAAAAQGKAYFEGQPFSAQLKWNAKKAAHLQEEARRRAEEQAAAAAALPPPPPPLRQPSPMFGGSDSGSDMEVDEEGPASARPARAPPPPQPFSRPAPTHRPIAGFVPSGHPRNHFPPPQYFSSYGPSFRAQEEVRDEEWRTLPADERTVVVRWSPSPSGEAMPRGEVVELLEQQFEGLPAARRGLLDLTAPAVLHLNQPAAWASVLCPSEVHLQRLLQLAEVQAEDGAHFVERAGRRITVGRPEHVAMRFTVWVGLGTDSAGLSEKHVRDLMNGFCMSTLQPKERRHAPKPVVNIFLNKHPHTEERDGFVEFNKEEHVEMALLLDEELLYGSVIRVQLPQMPPPNFPPHMPPQHLPPWHAMPAQMPPPPPPPPPPHYSMI